ncbi:hypothetical protein F5Y11DRAFT_336023 [Daldinia sp. FL1419]|nr:hypothetical protein F5Y11DRAFT_336023 [Daldinia sp. FL1419]
MAATNGFNQNDDEVIAVTLICQPHGSHVSAFPKRQFILSTQNPSVRIGRASKVPTKGFVASIDNAWFDSPVMSRAHAELVMDLGSVSKSVYIKDIGSLHGTFHIPHGGVDKETRLEMHRPVRLSNGDRLRFGTDIFRSKETFPPCSVEFYMTGQEHEPRSQVAPVATTNQSLNRTFTIPDDDIDDEDDDDDSVVETCLPPSQKTNTQRGLSIDLTQDEDDSDDNKNIAPSTTATNNLNSDVIDLTSEPDEHSGHEIHAISPDHSFEAPAADAPVAPTLAATFVTPNPKPLAGVDQSQKPTTLNAEPGATPNHAYSFSHDEEDEEMNSESIHLSDSEADSNITGDSDDLSSVDGYLHYDDEMPWSVADDDYARSDSWENDNESILPYSESDDASSSSGSEMMESLSHSSSPAPGSSPYSSPHPPLPSGLPGADTITESSGAEHAFVSPFLFAAPIQQGLSATQPREPSPSDAAMFKSRPMIDRDASISRAQALGDKSGKHAFFEAREKNRTNHLDWISSPPVSAIRETLSGNPDAESDHASRTDFPVVKALDRETDTAGVAPDADNASEGKPRGSTAILSEEPIPDIAWQPWSVSGDRFINHPQNSELPCSYLEQPHSTELDMTSAYTFQLSKIASESSANLASKTRRVEIQDLLTQEPNGTKNKPHDARLPQHISRPVSSDPQPSDEPGTKPNLKRSFDDAFSDDEDSIRSGEESTHMKGEGSKPGALDGQAQDAILATESNKASSSDVPAQAKVEVQLDTMPSHRDNVPPSKRRRFAQAAAYIALGGAAAFTYMVSTAPVL